jgi:hypothetical protein
MGTSIEATTVPDERETRPGLEALVWGTFAFCLASSATSLVVSLNGGSRLPGSLTGIGQISGILLELLFAAVGLVIVLHRPGNLIGWLLLIPSVIRNVEKLLVFYGAKALILDPGTLPLGDEALWVNTWIWMPLLAVIPVLLLAYPDGTFRSGRWGAVALVSLGAGAVTGLLMAIAVWPHRSKELLYPDNGLDELGVVVAAFASLLVIFLATAGAGLASLVLRFRQGTQDERLQIKWLALAVVVLLVDTILLVSFENEADWRELVSNVAFATIAVAIGVAVFKYRLYSIDVIIDRTLVYVPLLALVAGLTSALVPLSQKMFVALTGTKSDVTVVLTALLLTVLVTPMKKGLEAMVEGRFKPKPPSPATPAASKELLSDPEFMSVLRSTAEQAALDVLKRERNPD